MVATELRVGIVGAGTSGIYLASLLAQRDIQVHVFERSPQVRTEGCGILLVPAGLKALNQGNPALCQHIIDLGVPVQTFEFRNLKDQVINSNPESYRSGELPALLIHRGVILETLLEALPPDCLHLDAAFDSVQSTSAGVNVQFRNGQTWQGDLLIGADGIFSSVRDFVVPEVEPVYLGDVVWRGITADDSFCTDGLFIVYVRGRGIYANFFDLGNGLTHWGFFREADQSDSEVGRPAPQNIDIPAEDLAKLPERPRAVIESTPAEQMACRFSYDIDPLPQLYSGRVLLIGDAAHAKSPTRARGMTSGWEDAVALSRQLAAYRDIDQALAAFQAERMPIVHEYQRTSRDISQKIGRQRKKVSS